MATKISRELVQDTLPKRPATAHKGTFGTVGLLCGSAQYRGAALLCAEGALRAGSGIVRLASVEAVCAAAAVRLPGCVLLPLPAQPDGTITGGAARLLLKEKHSAILAGNGLGRGAHTRQLVQTLLAEASVPLVLDADALFALAEDETLAETLKRRQHPTVLTPHIGEMARLRGQSIEDVQANQQQIAQGAARHYGCTVVLKSHETVVADAGGQIYITGTGGNAGLAKGGSGDVLAGILVSLLGQGLPAAKAATAAVWLHAAAGQAAAGELGPTAMLPQDLPLFLARALRGMGR